MSTLWLSHLIQPRAAKIAECQFRRLPGRTNQLSDFLQRQVVRHP